MEYELRIIVEKVAVSSQEVVKRDTLKIYDVKRPESILDLGLRHAEQISLLEKCNGLGQGHIKSYQFGRRWLAITRNINGKTRFCQL